MKIEVEENLVTFGMFQYRADDGRLLWKGRDGVEIVDLEPFTGEGASNPVPGELPECLPLVAERFLRSRVEMDAGSIMYWMEPARSNGSVCRQRGAETKTMILEQIEQAELAAAEVVRVTREWCAVREYLRLEGPFA